MNVGIVNCGLMNERMKKIGKKKNKIARPQESHSFTAYTISKEQYDS